MKVQRWFAIAVLLAGYGGAQAQEASPVERRMSTALGSIADRAVEQKPYLAVEKTTMIQHLADGTTITHETQLKTARDWQGRSLREERRVSDPDPREITFTTVIDPVDRTWTSWSSLNKVATVSHLPMPIARRVPVTTPTSTVPGSSNQSKTTRSLVDRERMAKTETEDLGIRNIQGVDATGTRTKTTFPIGNMGNDRPIVVVRETWFCRELALFMLNKEDDPRTGTRTTEITELTRGEPDPALFKVPEGYTVRDEHPEQH